MKPLLFFFSLFICLSITGQDLEGAWKLTHQNGKAVSDKEFMKIYQDGYFAFGSKEILGN